MPTKSSKKTTKKPSTAVFFKIKSDKFEHELEMERVQNRDLETRLSKQGKEIAALKRALSTTEKAAGYKQTFADVLAASPTDTTGFKQEGSVQMFASGARRRLLGVPFHMIPREALLALAHRYKLGADKYGINNWQKGIDIEEILNHMFDHLSKLTANLPDDTDPEDALTAHVGAIMWGAAALAWYAEHKPDLIAAYYKKHDFV